MGCADARAGHERLERVAAESDHNRRIEDLELAPQIRGASRDLGRLRVAVARRPAFDDVGDEHVLAPPANAFEQLVEQTASSADERPTLLVLVVARAFAHEHHLGVGMALPRHSQGALLMERAAGADSDLGCYLIESLSALIYVHDAPSIRLVKNMVSLEADVRWGTASMITPRASPCPVLPSVIVCAKEEGPPCWAGLPHLTWIEPPTRATWPGGAPWPPCVTG